MKKNVIKITESQLRDHIQKIILEQSSINQRDPKRIAFFDNLAKQISSKIVGKTFPFGKIGVMNGSSITVQKYMDRNHAINLMGEPVKEFNLFFTVRRNEEDLYPNEKKGTRVWTGAIQITAKFDNGKLSSNPTVELWGMKNGNVDFSLDASVPSKPWTWDMVGGAELWSKAPKMGVTPKGDVAEQSSDIEMERLKRERDRLKKELANLEAQIGSKPNVGSKRPHDKMVMDCLKEAGFRGGNTGGKYNFYMTKDSSDSQGAPIKHIVASQQDPITFSVNTLINGKVTYSGSFKVGTTTNCDTIQLESTIKYGEGRR